MSHTDVVTVDAAKWTHPPFSATRHGGYVYGRGTVDDKDNLTAALMTMLLLRRLNVPLDRDVIFLAEAGKVLARIPEGSDYRPDPKSRTAQEIAWAIVCEERMIIEALESGKAEWAIYGPGGDEP